MKESLQRESPEEESQREKHRRLGWVFGRRIGEEADFELSGRCFSGPSRCRWAQIPEFLF